ncbi:hypothetical protein NCS52_00317700 [Fusarium sp. LHS14.1]|nr:hypothetical protein NCS52_00317700 [Fusarium sp. LHS14.1]
MCPSSRYGLALSPLKQSQSSFAYGSSKHYTKRALSQYCLFTHTSVFDSRVIMTIFPWRRQQKTTELQKYALGKRGDTYYISTKPAEPVRRSDICILGEAECSHFTKKTRRAESESEETEHILSCFWVTYRTAIHLSQTKIKYKTYTVSLYKSSRLLKAEIQNHVKVYTAVQELWIQLKAKGWTRCPRIGVARPAAKIFARGRAGIGNVPVGFMTRAIPALNPQHCMPLAKAFLDLTIRRGVMNDPWISEVRLRVRMGEMSPPNDHLNPQLLFRPVYFNQLRLEAGKRAVLRWAVGMGVVLATLHWGCDLDGEGVNFILGCSKNSRPCLWATDFGDCKPMKPRGWKSRKCLGAIMDNPTWPRPAFAPNFMPDGDPNEAMGIARAWKSFVDGYRHTGRVILYKQDRLSELESPRRFVDKLESAWRKRQGSDAESLSGSSIS